MKEFRRLKLDERVEPADAFRLGAIRRCAELAREDLPTFFEFVMRNENDLAAPMRIALHQIVVLDFLQKHRRVVLRLPPDHSKTTLLTAWTIWTIGRDPTFRGMLVGEAEAIAKKPLSVVKRTVEESIALAAVFPDLVPSDAEQWTQTALTVKRPPGIKDPTLIAVGQDSKRIPGSRLNAAIADDLLTFDNTRTREAREKVIRWFENTVNARILKDPSSKVVVSNQAWHSSDLTYVLQGAAKTSYGTQLFWPTLQMDVFGRVEVWNTDWDHELLVPYERGSLSCRLRGRAKGSPLWPERIGEAEIENLRSGRTADGKSEGAMHSEAEFNRLYLHKTRDDAAAACKVEYVEKCKVPGLRLRPRFDAPEAIVVTGVDLAVSEGEENDDTAFFTFAVEPKGYRLILDVEAGKWSGPEIVRKIREKHRRYGSVVVVENNAAQDFIRQFVLDEDVAIPVRGFTTGRAKAHPEHGIPGLFTELEQGAWKIPCDERGICDRFVERWVQECLDYVPSSASHTGDVLMASYFALWMARKLGAKRPEKPKGKGVAKAPRKPSALGVSILAR